MKLSRGKLHFVTPEMFAIRKGRMRAYRDAVLDGERDRFPHRFGITGVTAARDVR